MTTAIGIDVTGERIAGGIVHLENGDVLVRRRTATPGRHGADAVLAAVVEMTSALWVEGREPSLLPTCIGLSVCEDVDEAGQIMTGRIVPWQGMEVRTALNQIGAAIVEAGVRAVARAEARFGAGRGNAQFLYAGAGTEIVACLVLGGRPHLGYRGGGVFRGGTPLDFIDVHRRRVHFVLDDVAGSAAVARHAGYEHIGQAISAAENGADVRAWEALSQAGDAAGSVLGWLCRAFGPQALVIGGELARASDVFWNAASVAARRNLSDRLVVRRGALGDEAGLIGAALAACEADATD